MIIDLSELRIINDKLIKDIDNLIEFVYNRNRFKRGERKLLK